MNRLHSSRFDECFKLTIKIKSGRFRIIPVCLGQYQEGDVLYMIFFSLVQLLEISECKNRYGKLEIEFLRLENWNPLSFSNAVSLMTSVSFLQHLFFFLLDFISSIPQLSAAPKYDTSTKVSPQ